MAAVTWMAMTGVSDTAFLLAVPSWEGNVPGGARAQKRPGTKWRESAAKRRRRGAKCGRSDRPQSEELSQFAFALGIDLHDTQQAARVFDRLQLHLAFFRQRFL